MKNFITTFILISLSILSYGQEEKIKSKPIVELYGSANRTIVNNVNTTNGFGYGMGINIIGNKNPYLNFNFGFDFNSTSRIKKEFYRRSGRIGNGYLSNVTAIIEEISISGQFRYYFKKNKNLFVEQGCFIGIPKNLGLIGGLGIIIPIKKIDLVLKPSYVYGILDIGYSNYGPGTSTTIYNQYIKLSAGIRLLDFFNQ